MSEIINECFSLSVSDLSLISASDFYCISFGEVFKLSVIRILSSISFYSMLLNLELGWPPIRNVNGFELHNNCKVFCFIDIYYILHLVMRYWQLMVMRNKPNDIFNSYSFEISWRWNKKFIKFKNIYRLLFTVKFKNIYSKLSEFSLNFNKMSSSKLCIKMTKTNRWIDVSVGITFTNWKLCFYKSFV